MIVSAGTKNPAKLDGIASAFRRFFPDIEVRSVDSSSVARQQPVGLEQITEGAIARARFAMEKGGDFGVGVEAGIFKLGDLYFDHQQAAVIDSLGRVSVGHSSGFMLPAAPVEELLRKGGELEDYAVKLTGIPAIGDKGGLIHHLTRGAVSRAQLTEQCVVTALVPWLNARAYGL
jgi:inosine/xanthosine triphosphatase